MPSFMTAKDLPEEPGLGKPIQRPGATAAEKPAEKWLPVVGSPGLEKSSLDGKLRTNVPKNEAAKWACREKVYREKNGWQPKASSPTAPISEADKSQTLSYYPASRPDYSNHVLSSATDAAKSGADSSSKAPDTPKLSSARANIMVMDDFLAATIGQMTQRYSK